MKASQVIKFFLELNRYRLTMYQISKNAELSTGAITRIVDEIHKDVSLSTLNKIANGLARIDPCFEPIFWALISAKNVVPTPTNPIGWTRDFYTDPAEHPTVIAKVIEVLINEVPEIKPYIDDKRQQLMNMGYPELEVLLSSQMQKKRREEE